MYTNQRRSRSLPISGILACRSTRAGSSFQTDGSSSPNLQIWYQRLVFCSDQPRRQDYIILWITKERNVIIFSHLRIEQISKHGLRLHILPTISLHQISDHTLCSIMWWCTAWIILCLFFTSARLPLTNTEHVDTQWEQVAEWYTLASDASDPGSTPGYKALSRNVLASSVG